MRGSSILLTVPNYGNAFEGTIVGTNLYPGIAVTVEAGVSVDGLGRMTWQPFTATSNGDPRLCCILLNDDEQGFIWSVPYVTGTRAKLYCPLSGDEMNICVAAEAGTGSANAYTVGERLMPQTPTGQHVVQSSSSGNATFASMEHLDVTPDVVGWLWCMRQ